MNRIICFDKQVTHKIAEVEYNNTEDEGAFSARGSL